jgi:hypothetical protein
MASPIFRDMFSLPQSKGSDINSDPHDAVEGKPYVQMVEDAATLHRLLTLIFPVNVVLPGTFAEAAPLYSVLQKYEITSRAKVLRTLLAVEGRCLITKFNAFHAFALGHQYRLREETLFAAYVTLQLPLTFPSISSALSNFSGASLSMLYQYREKCCNAATTCLALARDGKSRSAEKFIRLAPSSATANIKVTNIMMTKTGETRTPAKWWAEYFSVCIEDILSDPSGALAPKDIFDVKKISSEFSKHDKLHSTTTKVREAAFEDVCKGILHELEQSLRKVS